MDGRLDIQFLYDITADFITAPQLQLMNDGAHDDDDSNTIWNDLIYVTTTTLILSLQDVRCMSSSHHHHDKHLNVQDPQYLRQRQRQLYQQHQEGELAENGVLRHKQQHWRE
eukprot:8728978-Ditylum_brightwellii.AAC.1